MLDFLKQLFNKQDRELTFVIFDEREPEPSSSYRFRPAELFYFLGGSFITILLLVIAVFMFTPAGDLLFSSSSEELRGQAIEIARKVEALEDSLQARNAQLTEMKQVITAGKDTTFPVDAARVQAAERPGSNNPEPSPGSAVTKDTDVRPAKNALVLTNLLRDKPVFPTDYPLKGTFTRPFAPSMGHFGIDIATSEGTPFRAIADGAVINQSWTLNYGWVLQVQHGDGIIIIYKHARNLSKSVGDIVLKGDILGTAGDTGIMSSGPHLHMEIWKNGVPQNPKSYLINQ